MATTTRAVRTLSKRALAKAASALTPLGLNGARLLSDEGGVSAIITALAMTGLLGFSALGVDVGVWYADHNTIQSAADSAAYSADVDLASGATVAEVTSVAKAVAAKYGEADGVNGVLVKVNPPPLSGPNTSNPNAVEVIISKSEHLFFSSFFLGSVSVGGRAVAAFTSTGGGACLQSLDTNAETSLSTNGTVAIDTRNCGIYVDSFGSSAMEVKGTSGYVNAGSISVVGGLATTGTPTILGPESIGSVSPIPDPYAGVAVPMPGTCIGKASGTTYNNKTATPIVLSPGTYCNGLTVSGGANIQLTAGTYIFDRGTLDVSGGASIDGTAGVTIVLTSSTGSNYATLKLAGSTGQPGTGSTLNLIAPNTGCTLGAAGCTDGIAILQDPSEPPPPVGTTQPQSTMLGGSTMNVIGALDFPTQIVSFTGNSGSVTLPNGTTKADCSQLIAYKIQLSGTSAFQSACAGTGEKTSGTKAALVE